MLLSRDNPRFRPVTIRIEKLDELDQLLAIIEAVAGNRVNHVPQTIAAAKRLLADLNTLILED